MSTLVARLPVLRHLSIDGAWVVLGLILSVLAIYDAEQFSRSVVFALGALAHTAPYIAVAVLLIAFLKASGAEATIARAFSGRESRMIVLAALFGGLAPFCSCEVIPFIAGLLALGAPLSAIMAFWLSSPLIDPPSLLITAGALGWHFAVAKAVLAVGIGLFGGFTMKALVSAGGFADPLRPRKTGGCGSGCGASPLSDRPVWRFWAEAPRRASFRREGLGNAHFLIKWLSLAYVLESLMIAYIPAEAIASLVGGDGLLPVAVSAVVGIPAYLNSYVAPPLVAGLMAQGMTAGAGMAFMVAGAVSSIPAMTAVYALVKGRVFAAYALLGLGGAILSGLIYGMVAAL